MKNIYLLGATGSIGLQTLDIISSSNEFVLKSAACFRNIKKIEEIIEKYNPEYVSVGLESDALNLSKKYPNIKFGYGETGLIEATLYNIEDKEGIFINAVSGIAGLIPTVTAIKNNRNVYLANKESLVVAGDIINDLLKENNVSLIPIDSEHNTISRLLKDKNINKVSKIIITASGGAFLNKTRKELENVTLADALNHPNWNMGSKITIDCALMVNKGLEVIEAHHLFNLDYQKIETVIHPESIIHSMIELEDNSVQALMYCPSMINPISYAIFGEERKINIQKLDFKAIKQLTFKEMDFERFPMLALAYEVGKIGGILPAVYNASSEASVKLFMDGKIKFLEIENLISKYVSLYKEVNKDYSNIEIQSLLDIDKEVKKKIFEEVK